MAGMAHDLARGLGQRAEAVCRHYLSNGRRSGRYWLVGDVRNAPGRSLFVRLVGPETGRGAAGRWSDAATGEHGDLLDLIRETLGLIDFRDVAEEARRFLSQPHPEPQRQAEGPARPGSPEAARRLFAISKPIAGTLAQTYLRRRGIADQPGLSSLRFHPRCYYCPDGMAPTETWPALIAAVTDLDGRITGVQRTWLARDGTSKAPVDTPRRAMGELLGHGVRFGVVADVLAAGEGIETVLSLRSVLPRMPMLAAGSAGHLAAIAVPPGLRRLYVLRDRDPAGSAACERLSERAASSGIETIVLSPRLRDFNDDLRRLGAEALWARLRSQLSAEDVVRFLA
ncbi:toprim domain-containing protein [Bosea eneae]|uniref:Toprim domain-containing protein n=1 Tax=Bosea eneae TaxID=151454 RepID=A0ABW0IK76_9HYPH